MSLSISQWQDEAKKISSHKRADLVKSIKILNSWPTFKREYDWVALDTLRLILEIENENTEEGLKS